MAGYHVGTIRRTCVGAHYVSFKALQPDSRALHSGDTTASLIAAYLPKYIMDLIGLAGHSIADDRRVLEASSSEHINQSIRDAFLRLDNEIMAVAMDAITGSHSFLQSMVNISTADSGSCALLAFFETATQLLRVACVGDSRAVLGRRRVEGGWDTIPLSKDQTCYNEDEVARLKTEHPGEPDMIKGGRLLGLTVTRAFGDLRYVTSGSHHVSQSPCGVLLVATSFNPPPCLPDYALSLSYNAVDGNCRLISNPSPGNASSVSPFGLHSSPHPI